MSRNFILDPQKPLLGKIFGLLEFLESKKYKINKVGKNLEFWGIFQNLKIFEKIANFFQKLKMISHTWLKVSLKYLQVEC